MCLLHISLIISKYYLNTITVFAQIEAHIGRFREIEATIEYMSILDFKLSLQTSAYLVISLSAFFQDV